jgi:hypothetical protein
LNGAVTAVDDQELDSPLGKIGQKPVHIRGRDGQAVVHPGILGRNGPEPVDPFLVSPAEGIGDHPEG